MTRPRSRASRCAAAAMAAALSLAPAAVQACDMALLLAHDVSHSVSREEYALQTQGHAAAFRDPEVQQLIQEIGGVSVMLAHWSAAHHQEIKIGWRRLRAPADIDAFAAALAEAEQTVEGFGTAIGDLLAFAETVWTADVSDCARRIVDVSGDGVANEGRSVARARARLLRAGVTINGLAIRRSAIPLNPGIYDYYRREVIGGQGAFAMRARGFRDYSRAFKEKLLKEMARPAVAQLAPRGDRPPERRFP